MNDIKQGLIDRLNDHSAIIGVVGLGYVGLPLALRFAEVGYSVLGIDVDSEKIDKLSRLESYIDYISPTRIEGAAERFQATSDFSLASEADALILCVPTPLDSHRQPDLRFVNGTTDSLVPYLREGQVVSLESTTYPGTTEEEILPRIESTGLTAGKDIFLVYSPEREDPANPDFNTRSIPKICGGHTPACLEVGMALYSTAIDTVVPVSSTKAAEMTKLLENIHRSVNIGLVNEMKIVADKMGLDIHEIVRAAATKPFGFTAYYPGPGLGGHCIPIDPFYLTWKAREYGVNTQFIELAGMVNTAMPQWVVDKLVEGLNNQGKALKGARILILGIAYKKNVDDSRESPAMVIMEILKEKGAIFEYSDPHIPVFPKMRKHKFDLSSVELTPECLKEYDAVVLVTNHDGFNYQMLADHCSLIVDTRGQYSTEFRKNVIRA